MSTLMGETATSSWWNAQASRNITEGQELMSNAIYRVLVIDDNIENRKQLENHLKTKGHLVQVAGDGQEGLDMLCAQSFDLILTGINLIILINMN